MAIINNAHAGSQVNLLCMIYRVLFRNNGKLSCDEISEMCRPNGLPALPDHRKRFADNLGFWMQDFHQLWKENPDSKLELTRMATSHSPHAIAVVTNEALFAPQIEDIFGKKDSHNTEGLFRSLGCLLASDYFSLESGRRLNKNSINQFYAENLPAYIPNDSEKIVVCRYGHFLGFLEVDSAGEYFVDPTRAVRGVLGRVFNDMRELKSDDLFRALADYIPLLDGGRYRTKVEERMRGPLSVVHKASRRVSGSLSVAIERLGFAGVLKWEAQSDDPNAWHLQATAGDNKAISTIEYLAQGRAS